MLIIKGICLLFSHLPTSHTTVRGFRIRRFRAFSSCDVWQVVFSYPYELRHFYPIVGFRPIVLDREFLSDI